jgi:hypothetical protein
MVEQKKKRTCPICGTEHNVGEQCPECEWNQEMEERRVKGELERERLRESAKKGSGGGGKKKGSFWD